jgi:capsular polysaccharide transport system permease protein
MNAPLDQHVLDQVLPQQAPPAPTAKPKRRLAQAFKRRGILTTALAAGLVCVLYWSAIASNRYVSEANVIIQRTDLAASPTMDFSSLLSGVGGNRGDELLLRDYLLSPDMLKKLDARLSLRAHFSDSSHDPLSRMWSKDESDELFHLYYLSRVNVELDEYSGVLKIKAQAYDAKTAQAITTLLMQEGERAMNDMGHRLAQDQVDFVEKQVAKMGERFQKTRQAVLRFQNEKGMVAPQSNTEQSGRRGRPAARPAHRAADPAQRLARLSRADRRLGGRNRYPDRRHRQTNRPGTGAPDFAQGHSAE